MALRPLGLTITQFSILFTLQQGQVTQGRLGKILLMDSTTLTRTLRPMERSSWIRSTPGHDQRQRWFSMTSGGRTLFEKARPAWQRTQNELLRQFGGRDWNELKSGVARLTGLA
jgi:DNA-binding MarR family transcriptional regulator